MELLAEPPLTMAELRDYEEGWERFAARQFFYAHESWERIWQQRQDDSRSFFQGLIQLAAAYCLVWGDIGGEDPSKSPRALPQRFRGALRNFEKSAARLREFPTPYLRVDVAALRKAIDEGCEHLQRLGPERLAEFPQQLLPKGELLTPPTDDGSAAGSVS